MKVDGLCVGDGTKPFFCFSLEKERDINSFFHVIITVYVIIKVSINEDD